MTADIDARVSFDTERMMIEVDMSGLRFETSGQVNAFYDRIEELIAESGEELWFFLLNFSGFRIEEDAWYAHHKRGKALNLAHSMGTVRYDVSDETRRQLERTAKTEAFDPNLFADHDAALERIDALPSKRTVKKTLSSGYTEAELSRRISFDDGAEVMDVDFSNFTFYNSADVHAFYDHIEVRLEATGMRWFFLVNMENCKIYDEAWVSYAMRGKALNQKWSMGSVRYATGSDTEETIRMRAESQSFRPNVRVTREDALARLDEMKREMA
ncbi:hypothetical protein [Maritimibacter dapengensis]|uniref:Uncharacterized protein n=1 Tax=Maritimibacter dapengensis TaxID=2836868 RepID=A0ABS6SYD3_9RHOB|nr:hypothetical protein [Maritimibacter dapengensis]MBV7377321.1 hypothetical protein [Maritimibacter dapengensis]